MTRFHKLIASGLFALIIITVSCKHYLDIPPTGVLSNSVLATKAGLDPEVVFQAVKGGLAGASRVVDALSIPRIGPSFGGVETLVEQPAVMSYYEMTTEQRTAIGIADGLVRLAVGIEEADDLIADLESALAK